MGCTVIWVFLLIAVCLIAAPFIVEHRRKPMDGIARAEAPGTFAELSRGTTHIHQMGPVRGPVIVCVHGLTTSEYVWGDIAANLIDIGFRVVTYDLYGRGYSDRPGGPQDAALFLEQLNDVLEAKGHSDSVILMGYSMGAAISVAFAAARPDKVDKLILVAPAGLSDATSGLDRFVRDVPLVGDWITLVLGAVLRKWRFSKKTETDPKRAAFAQKQLAESQYRGFLPAVLSSARHMLRDDQRPLHSALEDARVPTLALWGEEDSVIPLSALGAMTKANRSVIHHTVPGADHGLPYTHPEAVAKEVRAFLLNG